MEILNWIRQWSQSEHNSIEIPAYTDFWLKGIGAQQTPTWVGVETFGESTRIITVRNRDNMVAGVDIINIVPDVEEIVKIVKKQLAKIEGVTACSRDEFIENLDVVLNNVLCIKEIHELQKEED